MKPAFVGFRAFGCRTLPVFIVLPSEVDPFPPAPRGGALRNMRAPTSDAGAV
jgi:hypothetical protein